MKLYLAIRNRLKGYKASNVKIQDKIYVNLYIPDIYHEEPKKFIYNLNYYILMEYICALSECEGVYDKTFCQPYNCKCMNITNKMIKK